MVTTTCEHAMLAPMGAGQIPTRLEEITAEWLGECLQELTGGAPITELRLERNRHQGAASLMCRAHLVCEAPDVPASVVIKLAAESAQEREMTGRWSVREVRFYQELAADVGIAVPRCYHANVGADGALCLVLEDLSMAQIGKSADHMTILAEALAPFHARWWNGVGCEQREWLHPEQAGGERMLALLGVALRNLEPLAGRVPPDLERVARFIEASGARYFELAAPAPLTLIHGDLHLRQAFFPGERGGRFAVFDWSLVGLGNPLRDFFALSMNISPEARRRIEAPLLERYHRRLLEHGVRRYSLEQCHEQYRASLLTSALAHIVGAGIRDLSLAEQHTRDTGIDWAEIFFGPVESALRDHDIVARYVKTRSGPRT